MARSTSCVLGILIGKKARFELRKIHVHVAQLVVGDRPDEIDVVVMLAAIHFLGYWSFVVCHGLRLLITVSPLEA